MEKETTRISSVKRADKVWCGSDLTGSRQKSSNGVHRPLELLRAFQGIRPLLTFTMTIESDGGLSCSFLSMLRGHNTKQP